MTRRQPKKNIQKVAFFVAIQSNHLKANFAFVKCSKLVWDVHIFLFVIYVIETLSGDLEGMILVCKYNSDSFWLCDFKVLNNFNTMHLR